MTARTRWRQGRRAWTAAALGILALLLAAVGAAEWAGWPFLRQPIALKLSRLAGVPVGVDLPFRVQLLGAPMLTAGGLQVGAGDGSAAPFLLAATGLRVSMRWPDLWAGWRGQGLLVQQLSADTLDAHLLRLADGRASWQLGTDTGSQASARSPAPVVEALAVRQARVRVDDQLLQLRLELRVDALPDTQPGLPADAAEAARVPPLRITAQGHFRRAPLQAQFDVDDMLSLFTPHRAGRATSRVDGHASVGRARLKFAGVLGGLASAPALRGELSAEGPSLGLVMEPLGMSLPQTPPFAVRGEVSLDGSVWTLAAQRIDIGSGRLAGRFAYDTRQQPPMLSGQVTGSLLALRDLAPSVGASAPVAVRGRLLPETRLDVPSLRAMNADVEVAIDRLDFGTAAIAPLSALRVKLALRDGLLSLDPLSAQVAGGTVRGSTSLQAQGAQAHWQAALQFDRIALSQWVRSLRPTRTAPATAPDRAPALPPAASAPAQAPVPLASGTLSARVVLAGQGRSVAEVMAGADGQVRAALTGGTMSHLVTELAGLDVAQALGVFLRGDRSLALRCARFQAQVAKGVVGPVQGVMDNTDSILRIDGQIDLRTEALDLRLRAQPKDLSPLSLRTPVLVRGSLSQPSVSVEGGPIAARVLGAVALGAAAPLLAWLPLIDAGEKDGSDPCTPSEVGHWRKR